MNRQQRRAAKDQGNVKKLHPGIAIHEAGHAVARGARRRAAVRRQERGFR